MCIIRANSVYLHICSPCWHEFLIYVGPFTPDSSNLWMKLTRAISNLPEQFLHSSPC
nr:hypothetical protein Iba_chr02aCG1530 [Ipomoea batatas]GMC62140.1 hypothetical protein Iba_chr02cCG1060 [Ipomoea batatas]GMC73487.1 hypothetical protein Iba_scaffold34020CG0470 [Ipomoea batatas]GMD77527.1 hypothetical protein Iba_scaffold51560CG0010 [Ipomoea batatas]